ncbi:hypothetical protein HYU18_04880 [Candidatus Woesearchaeota archaeon]|nr:hypothetical protein [Candidatus Woesearchaeota archaeon]
MKDDRFLPVDKREPIEDYDDYAEGSSEDSSLFVGGEADADELESKDSRKVAKDMLYIAS